jgi:hypothetical protein
MHHRIKISLIIFLATFSLIDKAHAQPSLNDSIVRATAINNAVNNYHQFIGYMAPLYNGQQYVDYTAKLFKGHPFYKSTEFDTCSIVYENILYENVLMKYDLVKNKIVVFNPETKFELMVWDEKVSNFTLHEHSFIKLLVKDSSNKSLPATDFYDVLYKGKTLSLYHKETKKILEDLNNNDGIRRLIDDINDFYIYKNNTYQLANNKKAILNVLKDKKTELKKIIKKNNINLKENFEEGVTAIVSYYDKQLTK